MPSFDALFQYTQFLCCFGAMIPPHSLMFVYLWYVTHVMFAFSELQIAPYMNISNKRCRSIGPWMNNVQEYIIYKKKTSEGSDNLGAVQVLYLWGRMFHLSYHKRDLTKFCIFNWLERMLHLLTTDSDSRLPIKALKLVNYFYNESLFGLANHFAAWL